MVAEVELTAFAGDGGIAMIGEDRNRRLHENARADTIALGKAVPTMKAV